MKEYTITLNESDVKKVMRALHNREGYYRRKAKEKGNESPEIDQSIADDYKALFKMLEAL